MEWVTTLVKLHPKEVIAIDGKTIRGAKSGGKKSPIHMVSAWAAQNKLVLGQTKVADKSNEITAIPKLLEVLAIEDTVVTIDAMGCQSEIASAIIGKKADYILAVKEIKSKLLEEVMDEFRFGKHVKQHLCEDVDHGRIETRVCKVLSDFQFIDADT